MPTDRPVNLYAACRIGDDLTCKGVSLGSDVQEQVAKIFRNQAEQFRKGVEEEIAFDGSWKPDDNELLTVHIPISAQPILDAIDRDFMSLDQIDVGTFDKEGIKALFIAIRDNDEPVVYIQRFTAQQLLERKFTLVLDRNAFRRLSSPAFTLDTSLTCIIESDKVKFKSLQKLRSIIDVAELYHKATDEEVRRFAHHDRFTVFDQNEFVNNADQQIRKHIHDIVTSEILEKHDVDTIRGAAESTGLSIAIENGKIVLPTQKRELKNFLRFLQESRYRGPISGTTYVTNSRRPAEQRDQRTMFP